MYIKNNFGFSATTIRRLEISGMILIKSVSYIK